MQAIQSLFPELQQINDVFFELDSRAEFERLCKSLEKLVGNGQRALALLMRLAAIRGFGSTAASWLSDAVDRFSGDGMPLQVVNILAVFPSGQRLQRAH